MKALQLLLFALLLQGRLCAQFRLTESTEPACNDTAAWITGDGLEGPYQQMVVAKGPGTDVFASWINRDSLFFWQSADNGGSWPGPKKAVNAVKNGRSYKVSGITFEGTPAIACDTGSAAFKGRIYICWSDEKHGEKNKNVFLVYSDDEGGSWTEPILVTYRPNHREQFMPEIAVDQGTGRLYISYYDQQNFISGRHTDVYLAVSNNGGLKFEQYRLNTQALKVNARLAECRKISALSKEALVSWPLRKQKRNTVNALAQVSDSAMAAYNTREAEQALKLERTFAFADKISIPVECSRPLALEMAITRPLEPGFEKRAGKKKLVKGSSTLIVDTKALGLVKGTYTLTFYYEGRNQFVWITGD